MDDESDYEERRRFSPAAIAAMVVGGLALAVLLAFLFGWIVMLLWNWLMPDIFKLPTITYWQAWGLVLLSHLLIKGGYGSHGGDDKRGKRKSCGKSGWKDRVKTNFEKKADIADAGPSGSEPAGPA